MSTELDREEYEKDLARRQREHLQGIPSKWGKKEWQPCLHDACPNCIGTGIRKNGQRCVHHLVCPCPKCTGRQVIWKA